ncbi:hypothetical protein RGU72_10845 [Undibacterium sp. 5I1]|uniref:hypothetical protein n=1 Tax=unclassified Undibacterium TaxID=2630295 RepID=UPI002AB58E18|nr:MULTISPECIES: hypothetical protein [unclassified Undibacterium]MDY7538754.1 hypothetical protein [Undibacterium sp. 5I1]MEB0229693.1 hypothetical protein [Undibacterium sp. 10I3]MEB0258442.1 hypothetical protein [Undibacterium sp. 5I1]
MNTPTKQKSNIRIARENETEVLKFIALLGWLSTQQIGNLVWTSSTPHVARNKAALCLRRLHAQRFVLPRTGYAGIKMYVLTRAGADFVNYETGVNIAHHGLDLSVGMHLRQSQVIDYLTIKAKEGFTPLGASALKRGVSGVKNLFWDEGRGLSAAYYNATTREVKGVLCPHTAAPSAVDLFEKILRQGNVDLIGSHYIIEAIQRQIRQMR